MIQTILLLAIIGLLVGHFFSRAGEEGFVNGDNSGCPYVTPLQDTAGLTGVQAQEDDPRDLPWIASWSKLDRWIREGQFCAPLSVSTGPNNTEIHMVPRSCESGLPHTRPGDRIIMSDSVHASEWPDVIQHELIHISQRRHPDEWESFYNRAWAFTVHESAPPKMPKSLIEGRRANPDTYEIPWSCWKKRWWPVPIYTSPKVLTLRDAHTVWWDEWRDEISTDPPAEWMTFFGLPAQQEHPHEIAAVLLTAEDNSTEAGRRLHTWWATKGPFLSSI